MESSSHLLQPGLIFAERYRIERFLAQGGFGAVYVAEQLATELRVALKVLWPQVLASPDAVEKFKLEARVASRINSDYIVRVFDAGFDAGSQMPFLVMELLQGQDLEQVVVSKGPLAPEQAILYLSHVAAALDKAHGYVDRDGAARPIVHRDLKPENLFLTHRERGEPIIKVLDFGIAKVVGSSTEVSREMKGTPLFMAFEQIAAQKISPQTDVWALGLIAFYLLSGQHYWNATRVEDASLAALFAEVLSLPLTPPSVRLQSLGRAPMPVGFDGWFFGCVNREVSQRFATAGAAIAELAGLFGVPLSADAAQSAARARRSAASLPEVSAVSSNALGHGTESAVTLSRGRPAKRSAALPLLLVAGALLAAGAAFAWRRAQGVSPESSLVRATADASNGAASALVAEPPAQHAALPLAAASAAPGSGAAPAVTPLASGTTSVEAPPAKPAPVPGAPRPHGGKKPALPPTGKKDNVFDER